MKEDTGCITQTLVLTPMTWATPFQIGRGRNLIGRISVLLCDIGMRRTMNGDFRDLVSALLAIGYAAVLLALGELHITSRSTELPAISFKQTGSVSQALSSILAD
jgi:hypothetical protein